MPEQFAEVIGDPIAHSRSPQIHGFWLDALAIEGRYGAVRVRIDDLAGYFDARRRDPDWRGGSVTAPLKQAVLPFLQQVSADARAIGAVNCIVPGASGLVGFNTDVEGIAEALAGVSFVGARIVILGGGGAAGAAIRHCVAQGAADIRILARKPPRAMPLAALDATIRVMPMARADAAITNARVIINASPLGMAHAPPVPEGVLAALGLAAPGAVLLDMVYDPVETPLLRAARAADLGAAGGLAMLVGQARRAFELFFGSPPPAERDAELRNRLVG